MTSKQQADRLYDTGMAFAGELRLIGEHDAAHEIEVFILDIKKEAYDADEKTKS